LASVRDAQEWLRLKRGNGEITRSACAISGRPSHETKAMQMPIDAPEIPTPTPGNPTEPPPETPPGNPEPEVPPPVHEPGEPPRPDELPGRTPDEFPKRGPSKTPTPNPAVDWNHKC